MRTVILCFLIFFRTQLADACDYSTSLSSIAVQLEETNQVIPQELTLERENNSSDGNCRTFRVFFSNGLANNYQRAAYTISGKSLKYNLHAASNQAGVLKAFGDAQNGNEFIEGQAPERNTRYTVPFYLSLPGVSLNLAPSGTYFDILQVSFYGYNPNSNRYTFDSTKSLWVFISVPPRVKVSLIEEGGSFNENSTSRILDFGLLSIGQEKGADLRILSNSPYQVFVASQNNGKLLRGSQESISYGFRVNGTSYSLSSSSSSPVLIGTGSVTSSAGDLYNIKVRITENTTEKSSGVYQDVVMITAVAN